MSELAESNVAIVQRLCTEANMLALHEMRERGMKIIYDLDDNLWCLPAANPAKGYFEQVEEGFGLCASMCDLVTVSTSPLASAVRTAIPGLKNAFGKAMEIQVIPNAIDLVLFRKSNLRLGREQVRIGWGGSNTHGSDIVEAWEAIPEVIDEVTNARFEFVGMPPPRRLTQHARVKVRNWVPVAEYASRLATWDWDIMLAPLEDNRFNRSKSALKMIEAGALNTPCLVSAVRPYLDLIEHDSELNYLVCHSTSKWKTKIVELYHEQERRAYYGKKLRDVVERYYNIEQVMNQWKEAAEKVLG